MKKAALIIACLTGVALATDADEEGHQIIAKYLEAIGGVETLRGVQSVVRYGEAYTKGMPFGLTMYVVPPDKACLKLTIDGMPIGGGGTDGENAWQMSPLGTYYLTGEMKDAAVSQAELFPLLGYQDRKAEVSYLGINLVKGKDAHKILVVSENDSTYHYFDTRSFYLLKSETGEGYLEMSQHRQVGEVVFAHKIVGRGFEGEMLMTFDSIQVNVPVPDSLFIMPEDAKPLPRSFDTAGSRSDR